VVLADTVYEDGTECSETSEHKIQKTVNHPKERIQHSEHGENLKSGKLFCITYIETEDTVRTSDIRTVCFYWHDQKSNSKSLTLRTFSSAFAKLRKATISLVVSVCLYVRMEQLGSHCADFHDV